MDCGYYIEIPEKNETCRYKSDFNIYRQEAEKFKTKACKKTKESVIYKIEKYKIKIRKRYIL